ncbi:MAG: hypothetical protein ACM3UT_06770 [Chloroflexota bacterium]
MSLSDNIEKSRPKSVVVDVSQVMPSGRTLGLLVCCGLTALRIFPDCDTENCSW